MSPRLCALLLAALLLAGCSTPTRPTPGSGFPAQRVELEVPQTANYTGIVVHGVMEGAGDTLTITATARNDGPRTYQVETGCTQPWREDFFEDDERVRIRQPQERCLAFALSTSHPARRSLTA